MARGGSKRIPNKNIKDFHGKPIIHYSIAAALSSECFERVIVSTDSKKIAEISLKEGAEVPFLRSELNSNDTATTPDALIEVLECLEKQGGKYETFCCIYPTSPLIKSDVIKEAFELCRDKDEIDGVIPVTVFSYPIQRSLRIKDDYVMMADERYIHTRSQDLKEFYHDAGQFYFLRTAAFKKSKNLWLPKIKPLILPHLEVQDIDNQADWEIAELKYTIINS